MAKCAAASAHISHEHAAKRQQHAHRDRKTTPDPDKNHATAPPMPRTKILHRWVGSQTRKGRCSPEAQPVGHIVAKAPKSLSKRSAARALPVERRSRAGACRCLGISGVRMSHWGLPGYGYNFTAPHPQIYLLETSSRKVAQAVTYICSAPFAARSGRIRRGGACP